MTLEMLQEIILNQTGLEFTKYADGTLRYRDAVLYNKKAECEISIINDKIRFGVWQKEAGFSKPVTIDELFEEIAKYCDVKYAQLRIL